MAQKGRRQRPGRTPLLGAGEVSPVLAREKSSTTKTEKGPFPGNGGGIPEEGEISGGKKGRLLLGRKKEGKSALVLQRGEDVIEARRGAPLTLGKKGGGMSRGLGGKKKGGHYFSFGRWAFNFLSIGKGLHENLQEKGVVRVYHAKENAPLT